MVPPHTRNNVAALTQRHPAPPGAGSVTNITPVVERSTPPTCHSERSRGIFPSSKFYLVVVHYPTWWIPLLRLRSGRNDRRFWFGCYKCKRTTIPALRPGGGRLPPLQWGYHIFGLYHSPPQVIHPTWRAAGIGYSCLQSRRPCAMLAAKTV